MNGGHNFSILPSFPEAIAEVSFHRMVLPLSQLLFQCVNSQLASFGPLARYRSLGGLFQRRTAGYSGTVGLWLMRLQSSEALMR